MDMVGRLCLILSPCIQQETHPKMTVPNLLLQTGNIPTSSTPLSPPVFASVKIGPDLANGGSLTHRAGSVLSYDYQDDVADLCGFHQVAACVSDFGRGDLKKGRKADCRKEIFAERGLVVTLTSLWSTNILFGGWS